MENATAYKCRLRTALLVTVLTLPGTGKAASGSQYDFQKITSLAAPCTPAPALSRTDPTIFSNSTSSGGGAIVTVNPAITNGNYSINDRGDVSFIAALDDGGAGLYVREHSNGSFRVVARTGMSIPGVGTIADLTHAGSGVNGGALNDSGQVFFWATLTDGSGMMLVATPRP